MRKQIDGLAAIVELQYKMHFDTESIFLFCGRKADRIKALLWDGSGYVLLYKRLAGQQFQWPRSEKELGKTDFNEQECSENALSSGALLFQKSQQII